MTFIQEMAFKNLLQLEGCGPDLDMKINEVPKFPGVDYIAVPSRKIVYIREEVPRGYWITYMIDDQLAVNDDFAFLRPDGSGI